MTTVDGRVMARVRYLVSQAPGACDVVMLYAEDVRHVIAVLDAAKACADERGRVIERLTGVKTVHICDGCQS